MDKTKLQNNSDNCITQEDPIVKNYDKMLAKEEKAADKAQGTCAIGLIGLAVCGLFLAATVLTTAPVALTVIASILTGGFATASISGAVLDTKHSKNIKYVNAEKKKYLAKPEEQKVEQIQQYQAAKVVDDFCVNRYNTKSALTNATPPKTKKSDNQNWDDGFGLFI